MKKLLNSKFDWIVVLLVLIGLNILSAFWHFRIDLTSENRYTLSAPTKKLLKGLKEPVKITVFLEGDLPSGFKKLANSSRELLEEFKEYGGSKIQFKFEKIGEGLEGTDKDIYLDSMVRLGIKPYNIKVQAKEGDANEERLVVPGAIVETKGVVKAINLLSGQQSSSLDQAVINSTEALLEYKFGQAIQKATEERTPLVGYLLGNGETFNPNVNSLVREVLMQNYQTDFLPIDSVGFVSQEYDALVVMKPTKPFNDQQKIKIDQYIMNGGKVLWLIDRLYAEMDSLLRTQSDFIAFDRNLNLEDQLFRYGVRINPDLVQDLQSDKFPLVVGSVGDQPQMELVDWPYFPVLSSYTNNSISKNLNQVLSIFPNSIDTVATPEVKKTVLLATSANARTLSTPAIVSLNSVKTEEDVKTFTKKHIPIAMLLEGKFTSLYNNRLPKAILDTLAAMKLPFQSHSIQNKMIVISDADIATNVVTQKEGPLPVGMNQFTKMQYANKDFLLNCMEYLVNPSGILETRAKDFTLRLLDPKKVEEERTTWQLLNIAGPVVIIILFGFVFQSLRKRKYQR